MKIPESILQPSHPSYGCSQAWFVFGVINDRGDMTRVLIVEAKNTWAVQTLERVSNKDNRVNSYCELMTVGRQCASLGTRSDRAVEISYVDFLLDIVEPARLIEDYFIATVFERSLSDAERKYAAQKLDALVAQAETHTASVVADEPSVPADAPVGAWLTQQFAEPPARSISAPSQVQTSSARHRAMAALLDLGFKKQQVSKVLDEVGAMGTVEDTVKSALQRLYAV